MTGVLNVVVSSGPSCNIAVTVGSNAGLHGYSTSGGLGSVTPASALGQAITVIDSVDASKDLSFVLGGSLSQSFFRHLIVNDGAGSSRKYNSADATFGTGAGQSGWDWGDGSNKVWNSADAGEVHVVQVFR